VSPDTDFQVPEIWAQETEIDENQTLEQKASEGQRMELGMPPSEPEFFV
jgi:hypothetical protein